MLPILAMLASGAGAFAQEMASSIAALKPDCAVDEPDSVEISWETPCETGSWLRDTETGCRMWDWHPDSRDTATWTGACTNGLKEGRGVVQWFEHGLPIDRFQGTYIAGRRDGLGRYEWNDHDRFYGRYTDGLPNGFGTASIAGEDFTGLWTNGCLRSNGDTVAIGVPLSSCVAPDVEK
jgi:hypothetical protein